MVREWRERDRWYNKKQKKRVKTKMSPKYLTQKEKIKLLEEFIQRVSSSKELKRGLAVKLTLQGYT